jgi:hypothetical protein
MPEDRLLKYHYINKDMTADAIEHVFKYLSAFGNIRFVEDRDNPIYGGGTAMIFLNR